MLNLFSGRVESRRTKKGMLIYTEKIFNNTSDYIGHQVNCKGVMNVGVSKDMKRRFPGKYKEYKKYCRGKEPSSLLGTIYVSYPVIHLFGQLGCDEDGYHYTDHEALQNALKLAKEHIGSSTLALPWRMGAGLGGGDWQYILAMIENLFDISQISFYEFRG